MQFPEILLPNDISVESLQRLFQEANLETRIDGDGDLVVTRGVTCYVIPTQDSVRLLLLTFVGTKDEATTAQKIDFANRVNNQIATVRAHVNQKEKVVFDSHIPIDGGITGVAIVAATKFFLIAIAHAIDSCDDADIVR
ncbi:MAG: YbjN domain-containing protein [Planctomycetales bacterium]|nr:YbjN domain-containing protein [Planctomycetales bacterium]